MNQWLTWTGTLMCLFLLGGSPAYAETPEAAGEETVPAQEAQDGIQERGVRNKCPNGPEGCLGTSRQPLIGGDLVSVQTQQALGLVTVGGGCSGTLLNRFWVLTADHCVTSNVFVPTRELNGPAQALDQLPITAAWSTLRVIPTRLVRQSVNRASPLNVAGSGGLDVALIFLGMGDFGPVNTQILHQDDIEPGTILTSYGRGMIGYARAGPPAVAADLGRGLYRSASFVVSSPGPTGYGRGYNLDVNPGTNQVGGGGDSGGPDIVIAPNGVGLGIAGVKSTCNYTAWVASMWTPVAGQPVDWNWVTNISSCFSAAISTVRYEIIQIIQEKPTAYHDTIDPNSKYPSLPAPYQGTGTIKDPNSKYPSLPAPPYGVRLQLGGVIYGLKDNGDLLWYRHDGQSDGTFRWAANNGATVGTGWGGFKQLFSESFQMNEPGTAPPTALPGLSPSTSTTLKSRYGPRGVPQEGSPPAGTPPVEPKPAP